MIFDLWLPEAKRPIVIVARVRHATGHPLSNARLVPPRWPGTGTVAGKLLCLRDAMAAIPGWHGPVHIGVSPADTPNPI
jgi:hypothetical protein